MRALDRKLLRDMRRIWAQGIAIALVLACGVMVLLLGEGLDKTLRETRDAYYERQRFADVFAGATRAPRHLLDEIAGIEGVALAEGRVRLGAMLDLDGGGVPATAHVLSLPAAGAPLLNQPVLRLGRMPDPSRPGEVALSEPFALANRLMPGDRFGAVLNGRRHELTVAGHLLSPEFIYTIAPGAILPDEARFGLIWMHETELAAAADLEGAFNEVALSLSRAGSEQAVIAELDRLLAPYGGTGAHGRDRQVSHAFLQNELDQLEAMTLVLPPVFLIVAAFLVNMVLGRLIGLERPQIGLLKAVGYGTGEIALHYLKLTSGIAVIGVGLGWAAGIWLGQASSALYGEYFHFPWLIHAPGAAPFVISGLLGVATVLAGALRAVLATVRLAPAVAMAPPAPPMYLRGRADVLGRWLRLRQTTMMILRSIGRRPGRASVTTLGIGSSVAVLVAAFSMFDAVDVVMDEAFQQTNRQHVTLTLSQPRNEAGAIAAALTLPGVIHAEGGHALPVRLANGARSHLTALQAHPPEATLARVLDDDGRAVAMPPEGIAIPQSLAASMGLAPGDPVVIELLGGSRETWILPVGAVIRQSLGQEVHIGQETLFRLMRQAPQVSRLHLLVDDSGLEALGAQVRMAPAVAGMVVWSDVRRQFDLTINQNLLTMTAIFSTIGALITLGVAYNAARIMLSERSHELASLRVLGFSRAEAGFVLVGEAMLLALLAVPPGWLAGYGLAALMMQGFSSEIVQIPLVIDRSTYTFAACLALGVTLASVLMVRRRLDRIDIASALKQRE